ncbi:MAG TPA: 50S ribosomal protein L30 [Candidatus Sphingobacterium stercoripullorum]|uniref:Large ribosomal subunit protein uL30 n=1 Tax=Candidatus Sphingobacterium stercoripullorum TaxID=2838759 RepID=A0A9D1W751_9SPHI|nr:50S ribosomal protein L30 [Candidatus Sphingobacterium stercoripullorum]HLR49900.1 50S ribosomal protein L30 [Candidatus Sphingobacterium stercoripullorum]
MAKLRVTQIRSIIDRPLDQKRTIKALGLRKINHSIEVEANPAIVGMLKKVSHLIAIEQI